MAVSTEVIRFQKTTAGTNGQTQDVAVSFTPKAIILFSDGSTANNTLSDNYQLIKGFSDGTNHACVAACSEDAAPTSDTGRIHRNDSVFVRLNSTTPTTVVCRGSCVFQTNNIRFTWDVQDANAYYIGLIAIGGTDIANTKVNTVDIGTTGTGNQDYTGLGFTPTSPKGILFTLTGDTETINTAVDGSSITLGAAVSSSKRLGYGNVSEDAQNIMDTWRYPTSTKALANLDATSGAIDYEADFVDWISDGFRLNISNAATVTTEKFSYLAIKGGTWDIGTDTGRTTTGTKSTTVAVNSETLRGLMTFATEVAAANYDIVSINARFGIGLSDGTNEFCVAGDDPDAAATSTCVSRNTAADRCLNVVLGVATASSSTNFIDADFSSFGTNQFTLNYTVVASSGDLRIFGWIVVADGVSATVFERGLTESAISVGGGTVDRMLAATRTLSESSITVNSGSVARMLSATRSISESSISVSETLERVKIFIRAINESGISVSETLDRLRTAFAVINESSISVSETLARLFTGTRSISESSISVNETVSGNKFLQTTINEPSISVSETIARMLSATRSLSESSISVSETVDRLKTLIRSINESTISVSETLERTIIRVRTILENAIDVSEDLARQLIATRSISESSISVSETLSRLLIATRALSETSISVSEILERTKIIIRTINESSISVSETLTRLAIYSRSLSESSITVGAGTVARLKTIIRTINESSISVSETLARMLSATRSLSESTITVGAGTIARMLIAVRTIAQTVTVGAGTVVIDNVKKAILTEPAILVSDSLTRRISAFRTITETAILVTDTGSNGILVVPILAQYITDPGYSKQARFKLVFKSKKTDTAADESGDQVIYYDYDSYVPSDRPFNLLNLNLRLVQGEISTAALEIEDHRELIDDPRKIFYKAEVEVYLKKELGRDWTRMMTGVVRRLKRLRPQNQALHYQLTVVSKQVIYLERIINFVRAAKRSGLDVTEALSTDIQMQINNLFKEIHTTKLGFPDKRKETVQETGDFDLTTGSISDDVTDFITQIASGLTTVADVINQMTEGTGAIWGTDAFGNPFLRYPTEKHSGIILKDSPSDLDSATNTSVCMDAFEFEDIIDITEGFGNSLYVLNSKDTKIMPGSSVTATSFATLTTRWIAQSFIATENNVNAAVFVLSLVGNPSNNDGVIKGLLRSSADVDGKPYPTGPTLATFEISFSQLSTAKDSIFVTDIKPPTGSIIPGERYWWVLQGTGLISDSNTVKWHHDNNFSNPNGNLSARLTPGVDDDPTRPGIQSNWVLQPNGPTYAVSTFATINHILTQSDPESIEEVGLIEQVVNLPSFDEDATYQKVLVKLLQNSSKIKRVYEYARVTIPTAKFFFPGELVTVIDSKAKLNADKFVMAEIVEVSYVLDTTRDATGVKYCDLRLIGFVDTKLNTFLENKEC